MIYIIIPVFNRLNYTKICLASIKRQKNCEKISVIIVDDASTDGTGRYLKQKKIKVLKGTGSLFWGGAISLGIRHVIKKSNNKKDWIVLINNDVELSDYSISELITLAKKNKRKALVSALTLDAKDKKTVVKSGTIVESWILNKTNHVYQGLKYNQISNKEPKNVDLFTGRCLLHPIEIFKKIGNYNSVTFPHYGGDDEFSIRAKKYGYKNLLCIRSKVFLRTKKNIKNKNLLSLFKFMFNKKFSSNLVDKFNFTLKVVPTHAKISYFLVSILKTIYVFIK